jgi:hypothetical protein
MAAEDSIANIVELKPKETAAAKRAPRSRRRKAKTAPPPPPVATSPQQQASPITAPRHETGVAVAALTAALSLATCSAGFSIYGLTAIFAGAFWPVVGMGAALELGKLSAVAWLGRQHGGRVLRCALVGLVAVLMALNSVGVYGFLSRAHIAHAVAGELQVDGDAAAIEGRLSVQSAVVADLDRRIGALDGIVKAATGRGYVKTAMALVAEQTPRRTDLEAQRTEAAATLASLKQQEAAVQGERKQVEADLGPVRYLAALIGTTDNETMRCFILAVALLLDPAAVLLLLAAARISPRGTPAEDFTRPVA